MTCAHHSPTREMGIALIVALLATLVLSALGLSLLVMASTETLIAGNYRDGVEAFHAADAGLERAIPELAAWRRTGQWCSIRRAVSGRRRLPASATPP